MPNIISSLPYPRTHDEKDPILELLKIILGRK